MWRITSADTTDDDVSKVVLMVVGAVKSVDDQRVDASRAKKNRQVKHAFYLVLTLCSATMRFGVEF